MDRSSRYFYLKVLVLSVLLFACDKSFPQQQDSTSEKNYKQQLVKPEILVQDTSSRGVTDYFFIQVFGKKLYANYHSETLPVSDSAQLDAYLKKNINRLRATRFKIGATSEIQFKYIMPVVHILEKYHFHFFLSTKENSSSL